MHQATRNFCIIAHIDHGKSTLADRFIQRAHMVSEREFHDQMLDSMPIERERGITIKSQAVSIPYRVNGTEYRLNLVDTPGHVDFTYEVSRAICSCEGALLLIDATQGVEAQTLSNFYLALEQDLEIIPVINKTDLPGIDYDWLDEQIDRDLGLDPERAIRVSAKHGTGMDDLLEAIVDQVPAPSGSEADPLRGLIFDSAYDPYRGVVIHLRVFEGTVAPGMPIRFWSTGGTHVVEETGTFGVGTTQRTAELKAGDVGYLVAGVKRIADARVGDTVTRADLPCERPLEGFRDVKPVVFASVYPVDADDYGEFSAAIDRLALNDAALTYEKDSSAALGFGFRCGFLGMLHLEIVQERLEREFDLAVIVTVLGLLVAYPIAWFLSNRVSRRTSQVFLFLLAVPFVINPIIRNFSLAWLLGRTGPINSGLAALGLTDGPVDWLLFSDFAVVLGLVMSYMPFMIYPLWLALSGIDRRLVEASWMLGASPAATFRRITLPLSLPGVFAASIFGFVGTFGESSVPIILGGLGYQLMGNTITSSLDVLNYPLAAAMSSVVAATMLAFLIAWYGLFDIRGFLGKITQWRV